VPADKLRITLAGSEHVVEHVVEEGTTAGQALADRQLADRPIAAMVNG
jgi:sulfur carrier protein ThiS